MLEIGEHEKYGLQHIQGAIGSDEASQFQLLLVAKPRENVQSRRAGLFFTPRTLSALGAESTSQGAFNSYGMLIQCFCDDAGVSLEINSDSAVISEEQCKNNVRDLRSNWSVSCDRYAPNSTASCRCVRWPSPVRKISSKMSCGTARYQRFPRPR